MKFDDTALHAFQRAADRAELSGKQLDRLMMQKPRSHFRENLIGYAMGAFPILWFGLMLWAAWYSAP